MNLVERDIEVNWHPYTQMKTAPLPIPIVKGQGTLLIDENGKEYIDAISSWWVNIHGHSHPYIAEKIFEQLNRLEHVIYAGFTHPSAVELSERLLKILPENQGKIFYSDNGSTAVEVAIKMSIQYWKNQSITRNKFVALKNGYHGDTFGAMSVGARSVFSEPFINYLFDVEYINVPVKGSENETLNQLEAFLSKGDCSAFIFEPLMQGAAGIIIYEPEVLNKMLEICKKYNVLTIADEVATGFYRTGKFLATDHIIENPDIICLSKALSGGTLPFAVTSVTNNIYEKFLSPDKSKMLLHGHSFAANPVGCAAALASLDLIEKDEFSKNLVRIENNHKRFFPRLIEHPAAENCRMLGTILAFDVVSSEENSYYSSLRDSIWNYVIDKGVLLRPLGNTVYILPPYCITDDEMKKVYSVIMGLLDSIKGEFSN